MVWNVLIVESVQTGIMVEYGLVDWLLIEDKRKLSFPTSAFALPNSPFSMPIRLQPQSESAPLNPSNPKHPLSCHLSPMSSLLCQRASVCVCGLFSLEPSALALSFLGLPHSPFQIPHSNPSAHAPCPPL